MTIEKIVMQKLLEVFPKLKSREKQPPQSVIDEMKAKHKETVEKEKKEKPKNYQKEGGALKKKEKIKKKK